MRRTGASSKVKVDVSAAALRAMPFSLQRITDEFFDNIMRDTILLV